MLDEAHPSSLLFIFYCIVYLQPPWRRQMATAVGAAAAGGLYTEPRVGAESAYTPEGLQAESTRSPPGVHTESKQSP